MKAVALESGRLSVVDMAAPTRAAGQILARPLVCGICGSDLHARDNVDHLCDLLHRAGFRGFMNPSQPAVMGHEFVCEVLEADAGSPFARGQRVVSLPFVSGPEGLELIGYSNRFNGAFAEEMLLQSDLTFAVPDHVSTEVGALCEPLAVAVHAVAQSQPDQSCAFSVIGCGPVGLFIIARLRALGLGPILAIEPNAARRKMAEQMGADAVMAPADPDAARWWEGQGLYLGLSDSIERAMDPKNRTRSIIFDCVGKPGMLMAIAGGAPVSSTIVTVGNCMETDPIEPAFLLQKGLTIKYVFAYDAQEFVDALEMIKQDPDRLASMVTGVTNFAGVAGAFDALISGGENIKILIKPD
ncbi:zinc-binding dehydrogenase [Aquisediminimonas sediminicola]|uniref:zinc-binding dehydrogenase n=1 Tax=Alteraquisediminimonas sediminicola TaxID=2676787 RepID=UPI001C8F1BDE|nr:zinc-binding dehydrogenase [Aquisediminimonas sediminicola]